MSKKRLAPHEREIEEQRQSILKRPTWEIADTTSSSMLDPRASERSSICYRAMPHEAGHDHCHRPGCTCECHTVPHWRDRYTIKHAEELLSEIDKLMEHNPLVPVTLNIELSAVRSGFTLLVDDLFPSEEAKAV